MYCLICFLPGEVEQDSVLKMHGSNHQGNMGRGRFVHPGLGKFQKMSVRIGPAATD